MSQVPEGDKLQITKKKRTEAIGMVAMVMVAIGSILLLASTSPFSGIGFYVALVFWVISIILAVLGLVAFAVGTSSKGGSAYVAVSFLSALMLVFMLKIYISMWNAFETPAGSVVGVAMCSIGWIIGLVAGISGIVVTLKPTNRI